VLLEPRCQRLHPRRQVAGSAGRRHSRPRPRALLRSRRDGRRLHLNYRLTAFAEIQELVAQETQCCSFAAFDLHLENGTVALALTVLRRPRRRRQPATCSITSSMRRWRRDPVQTVQGRRRDGRRCARRLRGLLCASHRGAHRRIIRSGRCRIRRGRSPRPGAHSCGSGGRLHLAPAAPSAGAQRQLRMRSRSAPYSTPVGRLLFIRRS